MGADRLFDGRGRWTRWGARSTVHEYLRLDAQAVGRAGKRHAGAFTWQWSWSNYLAGEKTATITIIMRSGRPVLLDYQKGDTPMQQAIPIRHTPTHNGGHRLDWLCPTCGRAVRYLYGAPFACRHCHNLAYPSQQAHHEQAGRYAVTRRMAAIRRKLKMAEGADTLPAEKPPGVHWRTWLRLAEEFRELRHIEADYMLRMIYSGTGPALYEQIGLDRDEVMPYLRPAANMRDYRHRRQAGVYEPEPWLVEYLRKHKRRPITPAMTINQLAKLAGVPLAFAQAAEQAGLLRPDRARGSRWPKYRPKLARWLNKLAVLRDGGMPWAEIRDWSKRRWQSGEIVFPETVDIT